VVVCVAVVVCLCVCALVVTACVVPQGADPSVVSLRCKKRGLDQCGSLGAGNHYAEVQVVEEVFDEKAADGRLMGQALGSMARV